MLRIAVILHPTDFSDRSGHAFHLACSLARDHRGRVIVLHVAQLPPVAPGGMATPPTAGGVWGEIEAQLDNVRSPDIAVPLEHRLEKGDPSAEILRVAAETHCDLIVLGSHGRTGISRLLMGSVAEQVVRKAACPVLVVKNPFPEANPS